MHFGKIADMKRVSQIFQDLKSTDLFTVSENVRTQDTWFLLVISAIVAHLRLEIHGIGKGYF